MSILSEPATTVAERRASGFQPIAAYGLLADCTSAALVDRDGSIDWLCMPHYDSPAVFARILDPNAGHWSIAPAGPSTSERRYLPGTLVIETTFTTATGSVRLIDAMAFAPGQRGHDLGRNAPHEVLRLVEGVSGRVELADGARAAARVRAGAAAVPHGGRRRAHLRRPQPDRRVLRRPGLHRGRDDARDLHRERGRADRLRAALGRGRQRSPGPLPRPTHVAARIDDIVEGWRSWEAEHDVYEGARKELVQLSTRVLKGLTFRPTGAIVAAPTCSLPEGVGGERNWDYRYAWIRDASLTTEALYIGACSDEAEEFISFMTSSAGGRASGGIAADHVRDPRRARPLRARADRTCAAGATRARCAWATAPGTRPSSTSTASCSSALHVYHGRLGELHPEIQAFVADLADTAARRWRETDSGIWEMRGDPRHHLSSKVLCWTALDRAVKIAPKLGRHANLEAWVAERDRIRDAILERGWSEAKQAYAQSFDSDDLDAAALLMVIYGFLPATDPRMRSTIEAVARELTEDGMVLRYRNQEGLNADGLSGEEGTFAVCTFWLVSALAKAGEVERAEALFEQLVGHANDLGLLGEEIDTATGEQLGNFPQAYSHIGFITAAYEIDQARAAQSS